MFYLLSCYDISMLTIIIIIFKYLCFFFFFASFHEQKFHSCHIYLKNMENYFIDIRTIRNKCKYCKNLCFTSILLFAVVKILAIVKMISFQSSPIPLNVAS